MRGVPNFDILIIMLLLIVIPIILFVIIKIIFKIKIKTATLVMIILLLPVAIFLLYTIVDKISRWIKRPMMVRKDLIEGNYVINREMFKGKNADWQYQHYKLKIKNDTVYVIVSHKDKSEETFHRKFNYIQKGKHYFIEFYDDTYIANESTKKIDKIISMNNEDTLDIDKRYYMYDSVYTAVEDSIIKSCSLHHTICKNPLLHADAFSFNVVLQSKKFGNMFFTKREWESIENE